MYVDSCHGYATRIVPGIYKRQSPVYVDSCHGYATRIVPGI